MTTRPTIQTQRTIQPAEKDSSFKWLIIWLALLALCILAFYFMNFNGDWGNQADFGAFGDYVGGVLNPVLGFATVGLLIWSLKIQRDELSLSRQELALTRQELVETKEETALSRQAMEAQVTHLQKEAKLNELRGVLGVQIGIINEYLAAPVHFGGENAITYRAILNNEMLAKNWKSHLDALFHADSTNPVQNVGRALEIQLLQFARLTLEYSNQSNSQLYALPYLVDAASLLRRYHHFQSQEHIKNTLDCLHARIEQSKNTL
ncbi:hypothetical protein [Shewanella sp. Isolate8]|uniref:hypothetical protein n=1 Tax=Shewanella sp. Isolate8 TaxID=2908529 RepID=UPI001EFE80B3|nr:hypothetical protein [Shewanella sp. Isolate8]MCG9745958.1 hypothetical protein [Shewanella sp. Isolate8]